MTKGEFDAYLLFVAVFAFVIGVLNLSRPARRWLGAGAVGLGVAALLYRAGIAQWAVSAVCVASVVCLGMDVAGRGRKP